MNNLEQEILISMVYFPSDLDKFLEFVPLRAFSKEAREILKVLCSLKEMGNFSIESVFASLSEEFKQGDYFAQMLTKEANPNYLASAEIFIKSVLLKIQKEIGQKLYRASECNEILNLELLSQDLTLERRKILNLQEWVEIYDKKPPEHLYKTDIPFVDNCFGGGFALGQLMLIFGEPEAGKTMFSLQILENLSQKVKVCFFCFEFTINDYLKRRKKSSFVKDENFFIINDGYEIEQVASSIKELNAKGVKFFLIDSQMRISNKSARNNEEEESQKFSILARLCHSLDCFVMFICQNSKTDQDNPLGSKKGGHEASIIIHIKRTKPQKDDIEQKNNEYDENSREFVVKKNKQNGKHYKDRILFDKTQLRFYEPHERAPCEIVYEMEEVQKYVEMPMI